MRPEPKQPGLPVPHVSVVIPTRDRWSRLAVTLRAALAQQDADLEVIVVDDGSRDATPDGLTAIDDPRLVVLRNPSPRGVAAARNTAIGQARAPWVAFLDDDDLWSPRTLRAQLDAVAGSDAVLSYCDTVVLDGRLEVVSSIVAPAPSDLAAGLRRWNVVGGPSGVMARTTALERVGGFDERLSVLADWDLWLRLTACGPAVHCRAALVGYVVHEGGMFARCPAAVTHDFDYLMAKHGDLFRRTGTWPDEHTLALALAYGHARGGRPLKAARTALTAAVRHRDPMAAGIGLALLAGQDAALWLRRNVLRRRAPAPPGWLCAEVQRVRADEPRSVGALAPAV